MLLEFTALVIVTALFTAFGMILLEKWGVREALVVHSSPLFSRMFSCDFCLGFWISLLVSIGVSVFSEDGSPLLAPIFCSPLVRLLMIK